MRAIRRISLCIGLLFLLLPFIAYAQGQNPSPLFYGEINAHNINIRSDSTISSKVICVTNKGEPVEVIKESYEWYKIKLPKKAPAFIRKDLVTLIDEKAAKVKRSNVNIRLSPNESSVILGKADENEVVNILGEKSEWYRIDPPDNTFGWVNKKFVNRVEAINRLETVKLSGEAKKENRITGESAPTQENLAIEGIINPYGMVVFRPATHKLITQDNKIFLLKGNKRGLDSLNYHKVRVTGKILQSKKQRYDILEIQKIEALD